MSQSFYGFPNILGLLRATNLRVLGKAGATAGAGLAGGTTSGAPTSGQFDVGDAVIDQTGSLWICTTAGSPGTFVQAGFANPLSTKADVLVGGTAGVPSRLGVGSDNQVLTADSSQTLGLKWAVASANAGGALTQIAQTVLSGSAASITFSSIPGTFSNLQVHLVGQLTQSATDNYAYMQFNGDTGSTYDQYLVNWQGSTPSVANVNLSATTKCLLADLTAATGPASAPGIGIATIFDYARTAWHKSLMGQTYEKFGTSSQQVAVYGGLWRSTAAITSITLVPGGGSFASGCVATLYGLS